MVVSCCIKNKKSDGSVTRSNTFNRIPTSNWLRRLSTLPFTSHPALKSIVRYVKERLRCILHWAFIVIRSFLVGIKPILQKRFSNLFNLAFECIRKIHIYGLNGIPAQTCFRNPSLSRLCAPCFLWRNDVYLRYRLSPEVSDRMQRERLLPGSIDGS